MESPNNEQFGTMFVLCLEVVLFERSKMHWNYREKISGTASCVLYREIVPVSERPLSETSLYPLALEWYPVILALPWF